MSRFYVLVDFSKQIWRSSRQECIDTAKHIKLDRDAKTWVECYEVPDSTPEHPYPEPIGFFQLKATDLVCRCGKAFRTQDDLEEHWRSLFEVTSDWD
jgi:hypothetical protein